MKFKPLLRVGERVRVIKPGGEGPIPAEWPVGTEATVVSADRGFVITAIKDDGDPMYFSPNDAQYIERKEVYGEA